MKKTIITGILLLAILLTIIVVLNKYNLTRLSEKQFSKCFNQIPESSDHGDVIGLSLAKLSTNEEKEIHEVVRRAFEGQHLYRYYYKNEKEMDKLIEYLYLSEGYQQFKREIKEEYEYVNRESSLENILSSLEKMRFSKPRKYKDLDDRIGIIAGNGNIHYFLFKKVNDQWKIEKEIWHMKPCFLDETSIIKQIIERSNDESIEVE